MHYKINFTEKDISFSVLLYIHIHIYISIFLPPSQIFLSYLITQCYHFSKSQVCSAKRWNVNGPKHKRKIIIMMKLQHIKGNSECLIRHTWLSYIYLTFSSHCGTISQKHKTQWNHFNIIFLIH